MDKNTEKAIMILLGIHILSKLTETATKARDLLSEANETLQRGGARLYDILYNDTAHKQDLPGTVLPREAILMIAEMVGFPDPKLAAAVAMAESGGATNALMRSSREVSVGLWQINTKVHPYTPEEMRDPLKNAQAAFKISKGGTNWKPWAAFTNGRYKQFQTGVLA